MGPYNVITMCGWRKKKLGEIRSNACVVKERACCISRELAAEFLDDVLPAYLMHRGINRHQKDIIRDLKTQLIDDTDLLIHIDFAENYSCKYGTEIQQTHFGANKPLQVTLHTSVLYSGSVIKSFCTVTPDSSHDPIAIFHHLKPILEKYVEKIRNIHFLSDLRNTQYRNRHMFYIMIKHIIPMFKALENFSWNFSEAGHGKGAADGVGATVKRTCDHHVATNKQTRTLQTSINF